MNPLSFVSARFTILFKLFKKGLRMKAREEEKAAAKDRAAAA